jgi:enediyne biosynthesis protein E4
VNNIVSLIILLWAMALFLLGCGEKKTYTLLQALPASETNIHFSNNLTQTSHFNIIEYLYFYNGGGVSAGDVNNDGLTDLYFTANQLHNRLYLNKGNFKFEDITDRAGVAGSGNWKTGTTMADVNGDGFLDIFVCGVGNYKDFDGRNQLFINNQDLTFTDRTTEFGLDFHGFSTHAAFFDYDNDGDLDLYLLNHSVHTTRSYGPSSIRLQNDSLAGDRLYRNDLIPAGVNRFTDVTAEAGIFNSQVGYGLGIATSDLNVDGFTDIYVSNDFHENDYLYINQGNGTFREQVKESMPHGSRFSMGNDVADVNNDGLPDVVTLDMLPKDEEVIKTTAGEDPYDIYAFKLQFGYHHQFGRNALQLNRGVGPKGHLLFSDIAPLAGVEATDWSWAPLLADFDNDGHKDLFISNGILSRPNDLDYINFVSSDSAQRFHGYQEFVKNMPSGKVPNVLFRNEGGLMFRDVSTEWIGRKPTLSNGAAYADLDNDGDLDLVVNNINEPASIFRNELALGGQSWLQFDFIGTHANRFGIGTKVIVYGGAESVYQEQMLSRGWQSSVSPVMHIGLGNVTAIDSVCVIWPDRKSQTLTNVKANRRLKLFHKDAISAWDYSKADLSGALLKSSNAIPFLHKENDFNAFNTEKLIPHMVSTQGPGISVGDVNSDGLDDFFVGGAAGQSGQLFLQDRSGKFISTVQPALARDALCEDVASAFFDADGNGTPDLLVVSGGQEHPDSHPQLSPRLYFNDGTGSLHRSEEALPEVFVNGSCVETGDIDGDDDIDLFIGGRVVAQKYGVNPKSFLLINDGTGKFTDETKKLLPDLKESSFGMVTDASWIDINEDGRLDLILTGEWMPITILMQDSKGAFHDRTREYGLDKTNGWWNSIHASDFDRDGDVDFVAGNLGLNSRLKASKEKPVTLFTGDMDANGGIDHLLTYFNGDDEHPFISRDQLVKQVPSFKRAFLKYDNFRAVSLEQIIPAIDSAKYVVNRAFCFSSVYLENLNGKFVMHALPIEAQMFPVFSFCDGDFNDDGHTDLLAVGNLYAVQPDFGRYDSGYGLMMLGDGKGGFRSIPPSRSGFLVTGEGRDIKPLRSTSAKRMYLVSRNNDSILQFE